MVRVSLIFASLFVVFTASSQSQTTQDFHKKYEDAFVLFFYNNTLKMLNQTDNKEFDELVKDIEKMKFLMINKKEKNFGPSDFKKLVTSYKSETYEPIMTSRFEGKNFDVYLKEMEGITKGTVILVNDSTNLYVLDILGRVPLNKVSSLYKTLDETEISKRVKQITGHRSKD